MKLNKVAETPRPKGSTTIRVQCPHCDKTVRLTLEAL